MCLETILWILSIKNLEQTYKVNMNLVFDLFEIIAVEIQLNTINISCERTKQWNLNHSMERTYVHQNLNYENTMRMLTLDTI